MIKINRLIFFIIVSLILIAADYFGFLSLVKNPAEKIVIPVKKYIFTSSVILREIETTVFLIPENKKLNETRKNLTKENEELKQKNKLLSEENSKLREQMGSPLPSSFKFIPAKVISISRFMEIDAGKDQGVNEGMYVLSGINLIGKISSSTNYRSQVFLLYDGNLRIPVKTNRGSKGTLVGKNGTSIVLEKILQKDPLFLDDTVVTSGEDNYPPNLIVGKITHIDADDVSAYKQALLEPVIDFHSITHVFVINYQ